MSYPALTASPPRFARPVFPWRSGLAKKVKTNIKISKKKPCTFYKKEHTGQFKTSDCNIYYSRPVQNIF